MPTQQQTRREQVDSIKELSVPILCVKHQDRFYILDGHARSLRAKEVELRFIQAIILSPEEEVDFGIVKTTQRMKLKKMEDVKIVD